MADNTELDPGSGGVKAVTREVTHAGDLSQLPGSFLVGITGSEGSYTWGAIDGDATNGLDVDVTRVGGTVTVDGSGVTQPVSAASLPLPTGASTAAKQPALGTAGSASSDVITVQGVASMTALVVDGSASTQPVSGTVTANLGATDNAVLDDIAAWTSNPTVAAEDAAAPASVITIGARYDASKRTLDDGDVGAVAMDNNGAIHITNGAGGAIEVTPSDNNTLSTNNSTTTPLGISGSFTGTGDNVTIYSTVSIQLFADQDSATDGMKFQFSSDNINWDDTYSFTMTASETRRFQFPVTGRFFRVNYTNGGTGQGAFRVQTILHTQSQLTSIHRLQDDVSPDRSCQIMKSAVVARVNGTGDFVPVQSTASGILKIGGSVDLDAGTNAIGKLAANSGVDIGDVDVLSLPSVTIGTWSAGTLTVDNAGTFATQATLQAGTAEIGKLAAGVAEIGNVKNSGTFAVQSTLQTGSAAIGKLAANSGVDIGDVDVLSIAAGSNLIGDVGIQGRTTGGLSIYYDNDLDETAVAVKAAAGTLYSIHVINTTAAPLYLQLFDVAQGSVTVGTTTPTVQFVIPGNADSDGAGFTLSIPQGIAFGTAITAAASTGSETNGAPTANACHCNLFYK